LEAVPKIIGKPEESWRRIRRSSGSRRRVGGVSGEHREAGGELEAYPEDTSKIRRVLEAFPESIENPKINFLH
jgi:hypothetical protein